MFYITKIVGILLFVIVFFLYFYVNVRQCYLPSHHKNVQACQKLLGMNVIFLLGMNKGGIHTFHIKVLN